MAIQDYQAKPTEKWFRANTGRVAADLLSVNYPLFRDSKDSTSLIYNRETHLRLRTNTNSRLTSDFEVSRTIVFCDYISDPDSLMNIVPKIITAASTNNCPIIFVPSIQNTDPKSQKLSKQLDVMYSDMFELKLDKEQIETTHAANINLYLFCPNNYPYITELMTMTKPSKE
jgi:hypothetical protein